VERPVTAETISLIREMATKNRLWGAERIRGELLKLGIKLSKRTVQKYMRGVATRFNAGRRLKGEVFPSTGELPPRPGSGATGGSGKGEGGR
jgi:hypothetical protein